MRAEIADRPTPLRRGAQLLSRLVMPPACAVCRVLVIDAHALCPSCWRKLHFIERPFCEKYAVPFAYQAVPGALSPEAYRYPPAWKQARAVTLFRDLATDLVHGLKYSDRHDYAPIMARLMQRAGADLIEKADVLCAVPLHWRRLLWRRYNQSALLAKKISNLSDVAFRPHLLKRRRATKSQVGLSRDARSRNLRGAFTATARHRSEIKGKSILLVDDVMTSGATLQAAARALTRAGAREVNVLVFARVTQVLE